MPEFLHAPFAAAMSQSMLLPAFIALFGVVGALFLVGFGTAPASVPGANPEPYTDPRDDDDDDYVEFTVDHDDGADDDEAATVVLRAPPVVEDPEQWKNIYAEFMAESDGTTPRD
ncbi:hypothetical protein [Mycolicibacterium houstonense]|uniref:hypothetical protein n=1 Tax=Mycolicibacterium houstonense TaxID=146021 RepID=UPI000ABE452B